MWVDVIESASKCFVESVATMLVTLGHDERAIRTERYGGGRA